MLGVVLVASFILDLRSMLFFGWFLPFVPAEHIQIFDNLVTARIIARSLGQLPSTQTQDRRHRLASRPVDVSGLL